MFIPKTNTPNSTIKMHLSLHKWVKCFDVIKYGRNIKMEWWIGVVKFLIGGTVRPYGRANFFWDCLRFGFLTQNFTIHHCFTFLGSFFNFFMLDFVPFCLRKTFEQKYWLCKKNTFRKSGVSPKGCVSTYKPRFPFSWYLQVRLLQLRHQPGDIRALLQVMAFLPI